MSSGPHPDPTCLAAVLRVTIPGVPDAIQLFLSAVVGAAAGVFAAAYKSRKELESLYDIELRRLRIKAYLKLWKELEPLADWSPPGPVTNGSLGRLSKALRSWYFTSGGLYLSGKSRAPYFNLQEALTQVSEGRPADDETEPEADTRQMLHALASRLRTATTDDVATRVDPILGGRFGSGLRWPWRARKSPLRIVVDRRWDFRTTPPEAAFFVILENISNEEQEVMDMTLDGLPVAEGSFLLQPGEPREIKAFFERSSFRPGHIPRVSVTLAGGRRLSSREAPDVPLPTPLLERLDLGHS
jgi:hypothetical protein